MPADTYADLLPLDEVVQALRQQISLATARAADEKLQFKLNSIELEFSVVAKREGGADGKLKFSVLGFGVEAGAAGKLAAERTQKVKLSLTPMVRGAGGEDTPIKISDRGRKPPTRR